jgi:hypothetical protein
MAYGDLLGSGLGGAGLAGGMLALLAGMIVVAIIVAIALYIYYAFVLSTLAKKMGHKGIAWLAWVPIANLALFPILAGKKWPWVFILLIPIVNIVFLIMWSWAIFEKRKYPGWLSLIGIGGIIPFLGWLFGLAMLIIWGLVAWSDKK